MSHKSQQDFCNSVKRNFPEYFGSKEAIMVLDAGSMDINGNNRYLFENYGYVGVDVAEGPNVDVVMPLHDYESFIIFDFVISTEMLEHDMYWQDSLIRMVEFCRSGGMILITCASTGRPEHGTKRTGSEGDSPGSNMLFGDYYRNLTEGDIRSVINCEETFERFYFEYNPFANDLYFWGIKK